MSEPVVIPLNLSPDKLVQLQQLQHVFADVCNTLAPLAREHACWNRVALHHLAYHTLRKQYPQLGSQMVCNAIYSVSRVCRILFQNPTSPFNLNQSQQESLPLLRFAPTAPVYFDRHTLSIKEGMVSMLTLDGRIRFLLSISQADEARFKTEKLREIILSSCASQYQLSFLFANINEKKSDTTQNALPEYVAVLPEEAATEPRALIGEAA